MGRFEENCVKLQSEIGRQNKLMYLVRHAVPVQVKDVKDQLKVQRKQV